jgi:hypothetical protein
LTDDIEGALVTTRREFIAGTSKGLLGIGAMQGFGPEAPGSQAADGTGLVYDPRYLEHVLPARQGVPHPERPLRLIRMMEVFAERGIDQEVTRLSPMRDAMPHVRALHTAEHVESVRRIGVTGPVAALAVAGALGAVDAVARGRVRLGLPAIMPTTPAGKRASASTATPRSRRVTLSGSTASSGC